STESDNSLDAMQYHRRRLIRSVTKQPGATTKGPWHKNKYVKWGGGSAVVAGGLGTAGLIVYNLLSGKTSLNTSSPLNETTSINSNVTTTVSNVFVMASSTENGGKSNSKLVIMSIVVLIIAAVLAFLYYRNNCMQSEDKTTKRTAAGAKPETKAETTTSASAASVS